MQRTRIFSTWVWFTLLFFQDATGQVVPSASLSDCEKQMLDTAVNTVKASSPSLAAKLAELEKKHYQCVVTLARDAYSSGHSADYSNARGGEFSAVTWYPHTDGKRFPSESACMDPLSSLAHELDHCWMQGTHTHSPDVRVRISGEPTPSQWLEGDEIEAVTEANKYRAAVGLCPRMNYADPRTKLSLAVPGQDATANCSQPEPCSPKPKQCPSDCCCIYSYVAGPMPHTCGLGTMSTRVCSEMNNHGYLASCQPDALCGGQSACAAPPTSPPP